MLHMQGISGALRRAVAAAMCAVMLLCGVPLAACSSGSDVKSDLSAYSWDELAAIAAKISEAEDDEEGLEIAKEYNLVDSSGKLSASATKSVTFSDGTSANVTIAGFRADTKSDGTLAGITFVFTDVVAAAGMNAEATDEGGWEDCELRTWLNDEFLSTLPSDLKGAIASVTKKTNTGSSSARGSITSTTDKVWLLSAIEVSGSVSASSMPSHGSYSAAAYNEEGSQYQLFAESSISAGEANSALVRECVVETDSGIVEEDEGAIWWLRSLSMDWTAGFMAVTADGDPYESWFPDYELGVCPGFCL